METVIYADSPLAEYLEGEGHSTDEHSWIAASPAKSRSSPRSRGHSPSPKTSKAHDTSFAPRRPSGRRKLNIGLPQPLNPKDQTDGPLTRIHHVCSRVVNSRLGGADNARFLEHFRYIVVASQLLSEQHGFAQPSRLVPIQHVNGVVEPMSEFKASATSLTGALLSATTSFAIVWLVHWSRAGRLPGFTRGRILLIVGMFLGLALVMYAYARRQWLQNLRKNAVTVATTLVTNLQAFEASSSAALVLVQEVELVSRGYGVSTPMPPITRIEDGGHGRRCARIRRCLKGAFAASIPPFLDACSDLRDLITDDDLDKYLDVYEITYQDIQEAYIGFSTSEFDDMESLKALRILHARLIVLRRVALCALLSLDADGGKPDFARWRTAVDTMERLAMVNGEWAEKMNKLLDEEEEFSVPSPATPAYAKDPERMKFKAQIQKLGALSSGIRGLQAKLQILREESNKSIDEADNLSDLGPRLLVQYDSIGADLRNLVQAWEGGKSSLMLNLDRRESKRLSSASSGLRSPAPSLGGLTVVEENTGSPADALRALNGETSPPRGAPSPTGSSKSVDEEIFEAIALPKTRTSMTREQRIQRLKEEGDRMSIFRERREREGSMLKELESVIGRKTSLRDAAVRRKRNTIAIPGPMPQMGSRLSTM